MTAPTVDTWAVVARAQGGDREAFGELYERYRLTVLRFVLFRVKHLPIAEDIAQDVWVRVLKRIGSVHDQGSDLGAWLITISRNAIADYFKSGRYRLELLTGEVLDVDNSSREDWHLAPANATAEYMASRDLMAAVRTLNPEQQQVVVLRYLCGLSTTETAAAMGKNDGAVKTLLFRAIRSLRRDPRVAALAVAA